MHISTFVRLLLARVRLLIPGYLMYTVTKYDILFLLLEKLENRLLYGPYLLHHRNLTSWPHLIYLRLPALRDDEKVEYMPLRQPSSHLP